MSKRQSKCTKRPSRVMAEAQATAPKRSQPAAALHEIGPLGTSQQLPAPVDHVLVQPSTQTETPAMTDIGEFPENMAVACVYNYFVGYLRTILSVLAEAVQASDYNKAERMFPRFLLLVPNSCRIPAIAGQYGDYVIEMMEKSLVFKASHGDKERLYNPAVYSITYKDSEPYYFVGECPFILEAMHKINAAELASIDLRFQVERFSLTLMEIVNHRNNQQCHKKIHLIRYNDEEILPAAEIWKTIEEELGGSPAPVEKKLLSKSGKLEEHSEQEGKYFVTVTNIDSEGDKNTTEQIINFLTEKKVKFTNGDGHSEFKSLEEANFNVFVLSQEAIRDEHFKHQYESALQAGISHNEVKKKVVGVLTKGMNIRRLPQNWFRIKLLKEDEPEYLQKLWKAMQSKKTMSETIPVGNVFEGLAYAYLLNYLALAVTGTTADGKGSHFSGEEHLGELEPVVMRFRKYFLHMYRMTLSNGQKVCYVREYATPAITLYEMANTIPFFGLTKQAMNEQAEKFSKRVTELILDDGFKKNVQNLEDKVTVVYFDDEQQGITAALEPELLKCLKNENIIESK